VRRGFVKCKQAAAQKGSVERSLISIKDVCERTVRRRSFGSS